MHPTERWVKWVGEKNQSPSEAKSKNSLWRIQIYNDKYLTIEIIFRPFLSPPFLCHLFLLYAEKKNIDN